IRWGEPAMEITPSLVTVLSISTTSPGRTTAMPLARRSAGRSGSGPAGRAPRIVRWIKSSGTRRDRTVRRTSPSRLRWMLGRSAHTVTVRPPGSYAPTPTGARSGSGPRHWRDTHLKLDRRTDRRWLTGWLDHVDH